MSTVVYIQDHSEYAVLTRHRFAQVLSEQLFAALQMNDHDDPNMVHYFTIGLARYNVPELYIFATKDSLAIDVLTKVAERHVKTITQAGLFTIEGDMLEGRPTVFEATYLDGQEFKDTALLLERCFWKVFGKPMDTIFTHGLCKIAFPDELVQMPVKKNQPPKPIRKSITVH